MLAGEVQKQSLLISQTIELTGGELLLLEQKLALVEGLGFVLEPFGPDAYAITAVPALLPEGDYRPIVRRMVAELAEVDNSEKLRQHLEERLATMACHSVIRAIGDSKRAKCGRSCASWIRLILPPNVPMVVRS